MNLKQSIIESLLKYGIIKTDFKQPMTFKSGIRSPIYCDFRKCSGYPDLMSMIIQYLKEKFEDSNFDVIMGVHSGAATYAERLSQAMGLPSAYVRPGSKVKNYGLGKIIEGAEIVGKRVFLIEDLISTAGSVLENARIIMTGGAADVFCFSLFTYNFERAKREFGHTGFRTDSLITINDILLELKSSLNEHECEMLDSWVKDPENWFEKYKTEFDFGFLTTLRTSAQLTSSIICMGLDPVIEALPEDYKKYGLVGAVKYYDDLIMEMIKREIVPAMYKPNEGFYTRFNKNIGNNAFGTECLNNTVFNLHNFDKEKYAKIPICLDAKRADIMKSSQNYADQIFTGSNQPYSATTVGPYMGTDSIKPFTEFCNPKDAKGVYILNKTSNPGSNDFQMLKMQDGRYMYQHVSDKIAEWAKKKPGVGAVVGATSPEELFKILEFFAGKDIPVLVPGVGSQGGKASDVVRAAKNAGFELSLLRINSSSGITHPWYKNEGDSIPLTNECIEISINEIKKLNDEVLQHA